MKYLRACERVGVRVCVCVLHKQNIQFFIFFFFLYFFRVVAHNLLTWLHFNIFCYVFYRPLRLLLLFFHLAAVLFFWPYLKFKLFELHAAEAAAEAEQQQQQQQQLLPVNFMCRTLSVFPPISLSLSVASRKIFVHAKNVNYPS